MWQANRKGAASSVREGTRSFVPETIRVDAARVPVEGEASPVVSERKPAALPKPAHSLRASSTLKGTPAPRKDSSLLALEVPRSERAHTRGFGEPPPPPSSGTLPMLGASFSPPARDKRDKAAEKSIESTMELADGDMSLLESSKGFERGGVRPSPTPPPVPRAKRPGRSKLSWALIAVGWCATVAVAFVVVRGEMSAPEPGATRASAVLGKPSAVPYATAAPAAAGTTAASVDPSPEKPSNALGTSAPSAPAPTAEPAPASAAEQIAAQVAEPAPAPTGETAKVEPNAGTAPPPPAVTAARAGHSGRAVRTHVGKRKHVAKHSKRIRRHAKKKRVAGAEKL